MKKLSPVAWGLAIVLAIIAIYMMYKDRSQVNATNIILMAFIILAIFEFDPPKSEKFEGTIIN